MKLRITPLNIISSASLLAAVLVLFNQLDFFEFQVPVMKMLFAILFVICAVVAFVADMIFRKMIPSLKRLWLIEVSLITLTGVMMIVLKSIFG